MMKKIFFTLRSNLDWHLGTLALSLLLTIPLWVIVSFIFEPTNDNWHHIASTLLSEYVINSLILMLGVSIGTLTLGISTAWVVTQYQFWGKQVFSWLLLLPLAIPAYIIAYTYTGLLEFEGPLQTALRDAFGWGYGDYFFPEIRSLGGAIWMFSFVLYPYVFLLARASFLSQAASTQAAARILGAGPIRAFFQIGLPIARPAIIAGLSLALMETLADFGTVEYFGIPTFTTGIYRTWTGFGDTTTAAQLSVVLLIFVVLLMAIERAARKEARYHTSASTTHAHPRPVLTQKQTFAAVLICGFPVLFGFFIPAAQLLSWSMSTAETALNAEFFTLAFNTFSLAFVTAMITMALALLIVYSKRLKPGITSNLTAGMGSLGYAIPGTILAVAVMIPLAWIDHQVDDWMVSNWQMSTGLLLSGTVFALIFAYTFRFLTVSIQSVEAGMLRIKPSMDDAARSLGCRPIHVLKKIHIPMLQGSLLTAFLLVFVEVLKELPATLILRPFNFNTLSVRAYEMAADERLADAGLPALLIVLTGIIPVIILSKNIGESK